ncbi:MAG: hypothetical protein M0R22_00125 [Dehalococcoidia bacterium]|jgi:hypothetical protein|nr:hypothetical protein [Dehalococcoidia bacterium]
MKRFSCRECRFSSQQVIVKEPFERDGMMQNAQTPRDVIVCRRMPFSLLKLASEWCGEFKEKDPEPKP